MKNYFLQTYIASQNSIQGYFTVDAALMFLAYNQLVAAKGIKGDVLEIGVHHGRSAILVAALAVRGKKFVAVDLFEELQTLNQSGSGSGNQQEFIRNMHRFFADLSFVQMIKGVSSSVKPESIGDEFSFCHVDGGHTPQETFDDLNLCSRILLPGGLLALDDYFNPAFPGVGEGAVQFKLERGDQLKPIAIGFNKVIFQKVGTDSDLESDFSANFPMIPKEQSVLWGQKVNHFTTSLRPFFDLSRSTPEALVPRQEGLVQASFEPQLTTLKCEPGKTIDLKVKVTNQSQEDLPYGDSVFGLSYHLLSSRGEMVRFDNARSYFSSPLKPDSSVETTLQVQVPNVSGSYIVELDLVWEGMLWFKEDGNPTCKINLMVV
jgi:SAM-dependent methyltransferase